MVKTSSGSGRLDVAAREVVAADRVRQQLEADIGVISDCR